MLRITKYTWHLCYSLEVLSVTFKTYSLLDSPAGSTFTNSAFLPTMYLRVLYVSRKEQRFLPHIT
jgi:hypothetical protein